MNAAARTDPEPVTRFTPGTGSELSDALRPAIECAIEWAGDGLLALLLSGSHATGEAVWAVIAGRRVSLSDLDLYAVMRDAPSCAAAATRAAAGRASGSPRSLDSSLAAPLELGFVTRSGLARMPARPGTVELARSGRVVAGEARILAELPRWEPAAVSPEERRLLLENRAFELLWAWAPSSGTRETLRARHAVLKAALDLAAVRTLARGELPAGASERVARARECGAPSGVPSWLEGAWPGIEPAWVEALAWRSGAIAPRPADDARAEWQAVARAWCAVWWADSAGASPCPDPWSRALTAAARASLPRRLRRTWSDAPREGGRRSIAGRVALGLAGTPQHRIHGSAVVLLLAAAQTADEPRLPAGALHALRRLGVASATGFAAAATEVVRAWDRQLHDGLRTATGA